MLQVGGLFRICAGVGAFQIRLRGRAQVHGVYGKSIAGKLLFLRLTAGASPFSSKV